MAHSDTMKHVLVAGANGYLGNFFVSALAARGIPTRALIGPRPDAATIQHLESLGAGVVSVDARDASQLEGVFNDISTVISCMAAGFGRDSGNPAEIDRDANISLFKEAKAAGVEHFVLVATYEGREARHTVTLHEYKEAAVDYILENSTGIHYTIVRPTAYMKDFTDMPWDSLKKPDKRVTVVNGGLTRFNPVHGGELAEYIVGRLMDGSAVDQEIKIGGPETLTFKEVILTAADVQGIPRESVKFRNIPVFVAKLVLQLLKVGAMFSSKKRQLRDGVEFMIYASTHDSIGEACGHTTVRQYYEAKLEQEKAAVGG